MTIGIADSARAQGVGSNGQDGLWRMGPFRLTPSLRVGAGYDSNGFSSPEIPDPDINAVFAPGMLAVVPIRDRLFFELQEEVDFVYYRDLEELRDVFNTTRVGGEFRTKKFTLRIEDEFRDRKTRPTTEFDVPVDQRLNRLTAAVDIPIGWRHELTLSYGNSLTSIRDRDATVRGAEVSSLLGRTEEDFRLRVSQRLTAKTSAVVEGFYVLQDFEAAVDRDSRQYGAQAGFAFTPRTNVEGQILLGYKRIIPDADFQADFRGLIAAVDVRLKFGERLRVSGDYSRDAVPSILQNNWFFIENRFGAGFEVFITRRFSVSPAASFGRNSYPRPERFQNDEGIPVEEMVEDRFDTYSLSFSYYLTPRWAITLGGSYFDRESNFRLFEKDRFVVNFGLRTAFDN